MSTLALHCPFHGWFGLGLGLSRGHRSITGVDQRDTWTEHRMSTKDLRPEPGVVLFELPTDLADWT